MHILTDDLFEDWLREQKLVRHTQLKRMTSDKLKGGIIDSSIWTGSIV